LSAEILRTWGAAVLRPYKFGRSYCDREKEKTSLPAAIAMY
jgi:hypothetical protein